MKRPLAVAGLSVFFAMLAASCFADVRATLGMCCAAFILLLLSLCVSKSRRAAVLPTVFLSVLAGCLLFMLFQRFAILPAERFVGQTISVTAEVKSYPTRTANQKRCYVSAKLRNEAGRSVPGLVRVSLPAKERGGQDFSETLKPGDCLQFRGRFYLPGGGKRSVQRSFQGRRQYLGIYPIGNTQLLPRKGTYPFLLTDFRKRALDRLEAAFPGDTGGVLGAVLFGDKAMLSDAAYQTFRDAGAAHLLAVSGFHLSVWVLFLFSFFRRRRGAEKAALALIGLTVLVMALALFSGSVLRAGVMMMVYLFGYALHRRSDGLNSLGFAVLLLLTICPRLIMNVGFVLSVLATLAILAFALPLAQRWREQLRRLAMPEWAQKAAEPVLTSVLISLCASAATAPVVAAAFGSVSLAGILTNLLLLPLTLPLLLSGGAFLLFSWVPLLSGALHAIAAGLAALALKGASLCASIPHAVLYVQKTQVIWVLLGSLCVCALLGLFCIKKRFALRPVVAAVLVLSLSCCVSVALVQAKNRIIFRIEAVADGSCVLLQKGRRAVLLSAECDDYDAQILAQSWREAGLEVDAAVLPRPEQANAWLLHAVSPKTICCPDSSFLPGVLQALCSDRSELTFEEAALELRQTAVIIRVFGQTLTLSDEKTLALLQNSAIIHTDDTENALSTADGALLLTVKRGGSFWLRGEDSWRILMKSN